MAIEGVFALMMLVLAVLLIEQLGLAPRVRSLAWTTLAVLLIIYIGVRIAPILRV